MVNIDGSFLMGVAAVLTSFAGLVKAFRFRNRLKNK
jgi:hypothetical protein